jgi:hypothetical protein
VRRPRTSLWLASRCSVHAFACCNQVLAVGPGFWIRISRVADFDGPNCEGEFSPDEERLLASYPQPADTSSLPCWRQPSSEAEPPLDVAACCHVIGVHTLSALASVAEGCCATYALSLIQALLPFMVGDAAQQGSAVAEVRIRSYLAELAPVLEQEIACSSSGIHGPAPQGCGNAVVEEMPVLSPMALALLTLAARCSPFLH